MKYAVLALLFLAACSGDSDLTADHPMLGQKAPAFDLVSTTGEHVSLEKYKGKWVIMHFGTSW